MTKVFLKRHFIHYNNYYENIKSERSVNGCEYNNKYIQKGSQLGQAEVYIPLQDVPMGAMYVHSFPVFRKLKN